MFVLARESKATSDYSRLYHNADGILYCWENEDNAIEFESKLNGHHRWLIRRATKHDFQLAGQYRYNRRRKKPPYRVIDKDEPVMAKKKITGLLVDVFEDYEQRQFAILSKAESEGEFVDELSELLAQNSTHDWRTRLKEMIPLVVDMCCKYRGYRADRVTERRELLAGDLEMPHREAATRNLEKS